MKTRSAFWNNYKGIIILLVVFGHFLYSYAMNVGDSFANELFKLIYIFHMPAFIFCAGYLSKHEDEEGKGSLIKLLVCYLIFNTLMMVFGYFYLDNNIQILTPYNPYWYILSLIAWRILAKYIGEFKGIVIFSLAVSLITGFWDIPDVLAIRRILAFMFFYIAGYKIDKEKAEKIIHTKAASKYIAGAVMAIAAIAVSLFMILKTDLTIGMVCMEQFGGLESFYFRAAVFAVAVLAIAAMICLVPDKKLPLLTMFGENWLLIFLVHKFITSVYCGSLFEYNEYTAMFVVYAFIAAVITCIVFGSTKLNIKFNELLDRITVALMSSDGKSNIARSAVLVLIALVLCIGPARAIIENQAEKAAKQEGTESEEYLTAEQEEQINDAVKISYVGDLMLLMDMVNTAYDDNKNEYDFDFMFEHTKKYLKGADYTIGVLEGTFAGENKPYTTSNYKDGRSMRKNYPDEFAGAIKKSGIDMVTVATNHIMDRGLKGAMCTIDVLDETGLEHIGIYRNHEEKDDILVIEVEGIKIAVLSYLNEVKGYEMEKITGDYDYLTSVTPYESNKYYDDLYSEIEEDFKQAKDTGADLIMVMPHMGTPYEHDINQFQEKWNQIYADLGADIILGDHAQTVQPIEYLDNGTIVVNCPGSYVSSYVRDDGDASAIVEIYIDRKSKDVIASSIVPLYSHEVEQGKFRALPINSIMSQGELYDSLYNIDRVRIEEVLETVTENMIGEAVSINDVRERYYFLDNKYMKEKRSILKSSHDYADKEIYKLIDEAQEVAFIGDSITRGSKDNEWYRALMEDFPEKDVVSISKGFYTSKLIVSEFSDMILESESDLYIVAIGANDVRYRDPEICSMTPEEYIETLSEIADLIKKSNSEAKLVFMPPWRTGDNDTVSKLNHEDKMVMIGEYAEALEEWTGENGYTFINANPWLEDFFEEHVWWLHTLDGRHPTVPTGVEVYSKAVLESSK